MKKAITATIIAASLVSGCATLTNDPNTPINLSFVDSGKGACSLTNKRGIV